MKYEDGSHKRLEQMSFEQASPNLSCACWESSGSSITSTSTISCWRPASNRVKSLWIVSFQAYWFVSFHDWVFLESSESKLFQAFHRSHRGAPEVAHASPKSH